MPELSRTMRTSAHHHPAQNATTVAAVSDPHKTSPLDEFVLGFSDCANESLRYLEASDTGEAETSGQRLIDALRVHLIEHRAEIMRRRRRRLSNDHGELHVGRSLASSWHVEDRHSSRQPPRRQRRLHVTPVLIHPRRLHHLQELHYQEEIQTVHSQRSEDNDFSASNWKVTFNTIDDSGRGKDLAVDTSTVSVDDDAVAVATGDELCRENVEELHHCASQLSNLADHDVRVGRLLTELFQLMDSDDD